MKKTLFLLFAAMLTLSGCMKQDLDEIRAEQIDLDIRVTALEAWQRAANQQIVSLKEVVAAVSGQDYVTGVSALADGTGYVLNFAASGSVTIKNGAKGDKGDTGEAGVAPDFSIREDNNLYYWTLNGEYLKDADGNPLLVTGKQGVQGEQGKDAIAPQLRINMDTYIWEISTDGGTTWTSTGVKATGVNGTSSVISIDKSGNPVVVTITNTDVDGNETDTRIELPVYHSFYIGADSGNKTLHVSISGTEIPLTMPVGFKESDYTAIVAQVIEGVGTDIQTRAVTEAWTVEVTKPTFSEGTYNGDAKVKVTAPSGILSLQTVLLRVSLIGSNGSETVAVRTLDNAVQVGYYYFSDGSYSDVLISDKTPIGVVFYTGDVARDDEKLKTKIGDTSDGNHALVVALKNAGATVVWQSNPIKTGIGSATLKKMCGYSNSLAMKDWNTNHADNQIEAYVNIATYDTENTTPDGCSGWYLASAREFSTLCSGWIETDWRADDSFGGLRLPGSTINIVNEKIAAVTGAYKIPDSFFWSSSENPKNEITSAYLVMTDDGYVVESSKTNVTFRVRAILAF